MPHSSEFNSARARLAALSREDIRDDRRRAEARRDLAAASIADFIDKVLSTAPPLTDEQRAKLAELLKPVRVQAATAASAAKGARKTASARKRANKVGVVA
ncbi:hypothetical protein [Mycobacterium persicum]|uniref:hypothetical protein n=1 Tax=Mycobacterium persicum TaxID=1487726 RepID=UPI0013C313F0|nr:hypothetical protein [Mycobacterium persicum]